MPHIAERLLDHVPDRAREFLDSWKLWIGVAYVGLAAVVVALFILFENQSNEAARRIAIQRSSAQASLSACVNGVKNAPVIAGFIDSQRAIVTNSILTTTALLQAAPDDPLSGVRRDTLARLHKALLNVDQLTELISGTTPTRAKCNKMADTLGLPHPFTHR